MSPIARLDVAGSGTLGRCRAHRRPLLRSRVTDAQRAALDKAAEQARERLEQMGEPAPEPAHGKRKTQRRGYCPDCATDAAEAA